MKAEDYVYAARVPESLKPQSFGPWWIERRRCPSSASVFGQMDWLIKVGFNSYTLLCHGSKPLDDPYAAEMNCGFRQPHIVMEDSARELRKHLPIWLNAHGRVLVTGLGLGCVVRGLLVSPKVEHITVVEIDPNILRIVGHEFKTHPRVSLIHGDAFKVQLKQKFDYAWHDLWTDGERHLQLLHAELLERFHGQCERQGAWELPRWFKRQMPEWVLR